MDIKVCIILLILVSFSSALDNGLARTPPMGWLAWERFRCNIDCKNDPENCISERLFKDMADRLVEDGYKAVGYEYVNVDDCWMAKTRDSQGRLQADPDRFPNGIKGLADYVHSKGLKLGIYNDYGTKTCGGYPGSLDHLELDAQTFADWGVDMLKMDGCYSNITTMIKGYPEMTKYLNATGRPILFSCSWPAYVGPKVNLTAVAENCNIWRNYADIQDSWDSVLSIIEYEAGQQDALAAVAGPGNFNDPDMLIIGDFSLSVDQAKAQMAIWAMMAAPLFMSNDLRTITPEYRKILQNKDVLAVSQDPAGIMGKRILQIGKVAVWMRPLHPPGEYAIAFLNTAINGISKNFTIRVGDLQVSRGIYDVQDIYTGKDMMDYDTDSYLSVLIPPSGCTFLHFYPSERKRKAKTPVEILKLKVYSHHVNELASRN